MFKSWKKNQVLLSILFLAVGLTAAGCAANRTAATNSPNPAAGGCPACGS